MTNEIDRNIRTLMNVFGKNTGTFPFGMTRYEFHNDDGIFIRHFRREKDEKNIVLYDRPLVYRNHGSLPDSPYRKKGWESILAHLALEAGRVSHCLPTQYPKQ